MRQAQLHDGTVLEFPDDTPDDVMDKVVQGHLSGKAPDQPTDEGNPVINALRGFSARGSQAMTAMNPFATAEDMQKRAAEQEWVKRNSGAELGQTLADMAITAPAGGLPSAGLRMLGTGLIEGGTHAGSLSDKADEMLAGAAGSGLGEGAAKVVSYLAKPFSKPVGNAIDDVTDALREKARNIKMPLSAANETGNKTLQAADRVLSTLPSSSEYQAAKKAEQRLAWQEALFKQGGEDANMATPEVMGAMKKRIGDVYKDVTSRNSLIVDQDLKDTLQGIRLKYLDGKMPSEQSSIVRSYLNDFDLPPVGATIPGETYQATRSRLDTRAKNYKNTDTEAANALKEIRSAVDSAMERTLTQPVPGQLPGKGVEDLAAWKKANNDWAVMKAIEKGMAKDESSTINPTLFLNGLRQRDPNRVIYGAGNQELNDLAKVGKAFIPDKAPDSGTAINQQIIKALTGSGVIGLAGADYAGNHDPVRSATLGGASLAGAVLGPKAAAKAMWKPGGYLSAGAADLSKELAPGLTKELLIRELLRNAGVQTAN